MTALHGVRTVLPPMAQPSTVTRGRLSGRWTSRALVASLALAAGLHLGVAYQHSGNGSHGRFFLAVGTAQAVLALVLARRRLQRWLWAVVGVSVLVVATWLVARTPLFSLTTAPPGLVDGTATALEGVTIAGALMLRRRRQPSSSYRFTPLTTLALVALPAVAVVAFTDTHGAHHARLGQDPVDAEAAVPAPSPFGDLFDDHHGGHAEEGPGSPAHDH